MRYFVADLHFGHSKVSKIRFENEKIPGGVDIIDHHDAKILKDLNKVQKGDQVWILGDISSGSKIGEETALNYIHNTKINTGAQFHLIAGNHDSVSSIHRDSWKRQGRFLEAFDSVQQFARLKFAGKDVLLSHFPYENLGDGPGRGDRSRYNEYRLIDSGIPLIHGHTHQETPHVTLDIRNYRETGDIESIKIRNQYCVSWEVHRGLVKEDIIQEWLWSLDDANEFYQKDI